MTTNTDTVAAPRWWLTTWGKLLPGDHVQAPDGTAWEVTASIGWNGRTSFHLRSPGRGEAWSDHRDTESVQASRSPKSGGGTLKDVLAAFAAAGIDVTTITEGD